MKKIFIFVTVLIVLNTNQLLSYSSDPKLFVKELIEEALYYMLTRGIDKQQALVMLNFGFVQELLFQMPNRALADWLQPILKQRFERMMEQQ